MNLFWLDTDPALAAQAHQDVHVGKMLLDEDALEYRRLPECIAAAISLVP